MKGGGREKCRGGNPTSGSRYSKLPATNCHPFIAAMNMSIVESTLAGEPQIDSTKLGAGAKLVAQASLGRLKYPSRAAAFWLSR